ncbi:MAG: hypothetical protein ACOYT4_02110 [Nanoarchaeota archaeon]
MPPVSVTNALSEFDYLRGASIKVDNSVLEKRIIPLLEVFTQALSDKERNNVNAVVLNSIYVISRKHENDHFRGLYGRPSAYKRAGGVIEVSESKFYEKGYLEHALLLKLGDMGLLFNRIVEYPILSANAVSAFYLDHFAGHGQFNGKTDALKLFIYKHMIPADIPLKITRIIGFKIGNTAKTIEKEKPGTGLQYIYEMLK